MSEIVDAHIGTRVRGRRRDLGMSQAQLGAMCGVRFQQIQKYETAANHISAAMLWRLAASLGVSVQYFYEGLAPVGSPSAATANPSFPAATPDNEAPRPA